MGGQYDTGDDDDHTNVCHELIGDNAEDSPEVPVMRNVLPKDRAGRDCRDNAPLD